MPQNKKQSNRNSEAGNIFVIVMLGVILFAALGFTFSRSIRTGSDNISQKAARLYALDIISHSQKIERAVQRLMRNGCSENNINFENFSDGGSANPLATANNRCDVFNVNGGSLQWQDSHEDWFETTAHLHFGECSTILYPLLLIFSIMRYSRYKGDTASRATWKKIRYIYEKNFDQW